MEARDPRRHHRGPPASSSGSMASASSYPASSSSGWPASSSSAPSMVTTSSTSHHRWGTPLPLNHNTTITIHDQKTTTVIPSQSASLDHAHRDQDSLSSGGLAAAIVIPILFIFSLLMVVGCLWRRRALGRRKKNDEIESSSPPTNPSPPVPSPAAVISPPTPTRSSRASVKRHFNSLRSSRRSSRAPPPAFSSTRTSTSTSQYPPQPQPAMTEAPTNPTLLTANQNHSYFTGLDTYSQASSIRGASGEYEADGPRISAGGTTYLDPPPPYSVPTPTSTDPAPPAHEAPQAMRSPFEDPEDEVGGGDGDGYVADGFSPFNRESIGMSLRPASTNSLASTLYPGMNGEGGRRVSDPFRNPDADGGGPREESAGRDVLK